MWQYILFIDFVYCGFLVCICMAVSGIVRQKWGVVLIPFLLLLFVHVITDYIYSDPSVAYKELSPLYFLRGVEVRYSFQKYYSFVCDWIIGDFSNWYYKGVSE